jgi:quercetin dioxygenase-like cupin family protein
MPTNVSSRVLRLIATIKATFAQRQPAGLGLENVLSLLEPLPPMTGRFSRSSHAVTRHTGAVLKAGNESTATLLEAVGPVIHFLPWRYSYPPRAGAGSLEHNIAFAEIIGPEAPFRSDSVCLGLTLIAPRTLYPSHRHPAIETYYVVAGTALWTLDGTSHVNPPGTHILHPSQAVHSMQTHAEPLLAIYSWSGPDVHTPSVYAEV